MGFLPGEPEDHNQAIQFYLSIIQQRPDFAEAYYGLGLRLRQVSTDLLDEQFLACWEEALRLKPDWKKTYPEWTMILRYLGDRGVNKLHNYEAGRAKVLEGIRAEAEIARTHPLGRYGFRILSNYNVPQHIGHAALEVDLFIKMGMLGWRDPFEGVLLVEGHMANPCLMDYWKEYIRVVTDPVQVRDLLPLRRWLQYDSFYVTLPDGRLCASIEAMPLVQIEWEKQGREPLLKLKAEHYERGWECLNKMGVPKGAWFVCLHVREPGFHGDGPRSQTGLFRNCDISTYEKAIKAIGDHGGWVVRMGESSVKPLPQMNNAVDYAKSPYKSDWMDLFLCSQCKFFIGTESGLQNVPSLFGVPCAMANWTKIISIPCFPHDMFIMKLPWNEREKRLFTWSEMLKPPISTGYDDQIYDFGLRPQDNTPDDICDLVMEMLDRVEGRAQYTPEDDALQARARTFLDAKYSTKSLCRVGREYLKKYGDAILK